MKIIDIQCVRYAQQLAKSEKGRSALSHMLLWMRDDGLSLDFENKEAALYLLCAAFGSYPGTATDAMQDALQ